jgi:hypothetical protein
MRPLLALSLLLIAAPAFAQDSVIDKGNLIIYLRDQAIGAETFGVEGRADSINSAARSYRKAKPTGTEMIEKQMILTASRADFALRFYQSNETIQGKTFITGVVAGQEDTALTVFHEEKQGAGVASRLVAPPGRVFVLDPGIYSLFNLISLNLQGKTFQTRPISLLTLAAQGDTIIEAEVSDLGNETIRWGSKPVQARKLQLRDRGTVFLVWANSDGKMLRLVHEPSGLRVEREAPAVKKRSTATPKPGG